MKRKDTSRWALIVVIVACVLFPFFLNLMLGIEAFVPVVGDSTTWLSFWPVYLSAIASFGMIYITYRSLQQNKKQIEEMQKQREEEERARLVFSVIVYQHAFMLKISNIGKRNVFNAVIDFNEDFLTELLQEKFQEGYKQLSKPFFVEAGTSRYLFIGFCQDVNDAWKNKNVVIRMKGSYNEIYTIDEEIEMNMFLDKTFIIVEGDLETTMGHIKKGLVVQNNQYMPVQKSLDQIAKSITKVESSLESIVEHLEDQQNAVFDEHEDAIESQASIIDGANVVESGQE